MSAAEHKSHAKEYIIIFIILVVLTALELAIPGIDTSYGLKASSLVALALGKAFVVAYYYMHLKDEKGWLKFIAAVPISAALFAFVVVLEAMYR